MKLKKGSFTAKRRDFWQESDDEVTVLAIQNEEEGKKPSPSRF